MIRRRRQASASVELSVCLPLFVLTVVGTIETCSLIHLRETLCVASYEAARLASQGPSQEQAAVERATQIVAARGISGAEVVFSPKDLGAIAVGDYVTVTVRVKTATQSLLPQVVYGNTFISAQSTMVKEKG